ncbi:hypothetical protein [Vibrio natriegens]|uniref:hypothetical protein n=1 Tax=Vibrio natriegens TaxID=691 RepID=UPI003B593D96
MTEQSVTEVRFHWKQFVATPEAQAILLAVGFGYQTRSQLLQALPMFQQNRLQHGLQALLGTDMVTISGQQLLLCDDIEVLQKLTSSPQPLTLPMAQVSLTWEDKAALLQRLGVQNPGRALSAISIAAKTVEVE